MTATMTRSVRHADADQTHSGEALCVRPWLVLPAVVGGLLLALGAAAVLGASVQRTTGRPAPAASFPTVGTSARTYPPGHSSGWHVHPGLHSVVILSGALVVYDENCVRTEYGPGQTYLGGSAPHLARNETSDGVALAITFMYRSTNEDHGSVVRAPSGCEVR